VRSHAFDARSAKYSASDLGTFQSIIEPIASESPFILTIGANPKTDTIDVELNASDPALVAELHAAVPPDAIRVLVHPGEVIQRHRRFAWLSAPRHRHRMTA